MELTIPVFNETVKKPGQSDPVHQLSALFWPKIHAEDINLRRASVRLQGRLQKALNPLGRTWDHAELIRLAMNPDISQHRLKLELDLKTRRFKFTVFLVCFPMLDHFAAFAPALPELWFDVSSPGQLKHRAEQVYRDFFRKMENDADDHRRPENYSNRGEAWISWHDVNIRTDPPTQEEIEKNLMALFSREQMDGVTELDAVGQCLDLLYPEDLSRTLMRDKQVDQLDELLARPARRPILIVGPHLVGKTALIHEVVYRRVDRRRKKNATKNNVWQLSPQRLISGMSFVGQWEERLLAILGESQKRDHVLYFDDLLAMFQAGQSRESRLCVADLIKNSIQDQQVRIIAELTSQAFHVLETRDRGFADLFQIIRLQPTSANETRQIAIRSIQRIESEKRCTFDWDVIQQATHIQERFATAAAMPGKLIDYLETLGTAGKKGHIQSYDALKTFRDMHGLSRMTLGFGSLDFSEIKSSFRKRIIGQNDAVQVCANVAATLRAGLNEPDRPIATLLFLGPTGVGKTECAKALADVMFNGQQHLLRFDLNQFKTAWSASTLVGTPDRPEGQLTSAVRQRPFSIVLLDEIEKAHPSVFDVLLQVLGEGRLTDALGRTTDFSNCVVVMTSNLGTKRNQQQPGFSPVDDSHRYHKAAKDFFRPEFYNRIDEIVPFTGLTRPQVRTIASRLVREITGRQGLSRRHCVLQISRSAIDHTVDLGFHPELGARAMKRALENQLTRPVAHFLAATPVDQITVVGISRSDQKLKVQAQPVLESPQVRGETPSMKPDHIVRCASNFLDRIQEQHLSNRPQGELSANSISPELLRYFALDEQRNQVRESLSQLQQSLEQTSHSISTAKAPQPRIRTSLNRSRTNRIGLQLIREIRANNDIAEWLSDVEAAQTISPQEQLVEDLVDRAAFLQAMADDNGPQQTVLYICDQQMDLSSANSDLTYQRTLMRQIKNLLNNHFPVAVSTADTDTPIDGYPWIRIEGAAANVLKQCLVGGYMQVNSLGEFHLHRIQSLSEDLVRETGIHGAMKTVQKQFDFESSNNNTEPPEPFFNRRVYSHDGVVVDFPSGITARTGSRQFMSQLLQMTLKSFPLPIEFSQKENNA